MDEIRPLFRENEKTDLASTRVNLRILLDTLSIITVYTIVQSNFSIVELRINLLNLKEQVREFILETCTPQLGAENFKNRFGSVNARC